MATPFLIVRVRGWLCALPLSQVIETMRAPVPQKGTAEFTGWLGPTLLRGTLVATLDLGALLKLKIEADAPAPRRAVSVRLDFDSGSNSDCVLLTVDEVIGVKSLEDDQRHTLPLPGGDDRHIGRFDIGFARLLAASSLIDEEALASFERDTALAAVPA